jgi:hypothetical protein
MSNEYYEEQMAKWEPVDVDDVDDEDDDTDNNVVKKENDYETD